MQVKERPILFSAPMVRAILAGTKTQTRRPLKAPHGLAVPDRMRTSTWDNGDTIAEWPYVLADGMGGMNGYTSVRCPYGSPGDRLWGRETWRVPGAVPRSDDPVRPGMRIEYRADEAPSTDGFVWRPSIFMPRWASRITLELTGVRVERVQSISEADAVAEGFEAKPFPGPWWQGYRESSLGLLHQQACGESAPDWMIEPKRMPDTKHLDRSAIDGFRNIWWSIHGGKSWDANPWVWVVEFKSVHEERNNT